MDWSTCIDASGVATINCIPLLIANFIFWGIMLSGSVAVIFIIIGGIRFVTSGGDSKKIEQARKTIVFSILGLFLIILSFFVVNIIGSITGVACINPAKPLSFYTCT